MLKRLFALTSLLALMTACTPFKPTGDFSDVRGRVFSRYFNGPLANAKVSIPNYSMNVMTDADGYFEIRGLPTKWLEIDVQHPSHREAKRPVEIQPFGSKYVEIYMDKDQAVGKPAIVFERNFDIWTTDIYGQQQKNLTVNQPRNLYRSYPVWSQDKEKIGYIAYETSSRVALNDDGVWTMRNDGTMPRKLTYVQDIGRIYHLDWIGDRCMFMLQDRIFVYDQRLGTQRSLSGNLNTRGGTFESFNAGPVFTADASQVITSAYAVDFNTNWRFGSRFRQIYILDEQGGTRRQLTTEGDNYAPAVSHDGTKIAYVSTVSGQPELWTMNINGSDPQQMTFMKAEQVGQPRWTSDDQYLLFTSSYMQNYKSKEPRELWAVDLIGRKPHMVTNDALHADG